MTLLLTKHPRLAKRTSMCGIAGIIGRLDEANRDALAKMNVALRHRGPDGEGTWESAADDSGYGCLLGHRRLAILDLSPSAHQPMIDPISGQAIVYNGEVYNFAELRRDLSSANYQFKSTGDSEVALRALAVWGPREGVKRLRGMFAFGLWDQKARRLTLARDALGIKPLYWCRNPERNASWAIVFASELRAILASGLLSNPRLDPVAVSSVLWNGFVVGPSTAVKGVESVSAGQLLEFDSRGALAHSEDHWTFAQGRALDRSKVVNEQEADQAVAESIRLHLASDVPLGVFLSGGVDSAAVANLAVQQSSEPVHTFTLTFEEEEFNEGPIARRVADAIGTAHHEVLLTQSRFLAGIDEASASLDQPTFDGLNSYFVSRAVRDAGITVALTGTGGDELFGGYTSFIRLQRLLRIVSVGSRVPAFARQSVARAIATLASVAAKRRTGFIGAQAGWVKLPEILSGTPDLTNLYQLAYAMFLPRFQRELLSEQCIDASSGDGLNDTFRERLSRELVGHSPLSAISVLEQRIFLGERLLPDTDSASMAVSLETRLPLVDVKVAEAVMGMRDHDRFDPLGRKALLRRIGLKGLDPSLFDRTKSGFVLPFDKWIREGMLTKMRDLVLDERAVSAVGLRPSAVARLWSAFIDKRQGLYWSRLWAVYSLIDWCHRYQVFL